MDLFFDYKRQKGKVGLFDLVDVKEPSRSSSTMTRAFCQLSAAARLALPPVPPYERYRGIVHMTAAPDSPHRRAALMEAAGAAGLHKLTPRVFLVRQRAGNLWRSFPDVAGQEHRRGPRRLGKRV